MREEGQGRKGLQIDAENGSTLILFRSGKLQEMLHDLDVAPDLKAGAIFADPIGESRELE